ncbi:MAG: hypothetical protein ACEY3K_06155, partial [Wolbachia sp.]
MTKNAKETLQLLKPTFVKPEFTKPEITPLFFDKKANKEIDITSNDIDVKDIDEKMMVNVTRFKAFYDNLMKSINEYNNSMSSSIENNIVKPLSITIDSIDSKISSIDSELADLRNSIPDIGEAPPLLHITGEENGL